MAKHQRKPGVSSPRIVNRKASHNYQLDEALECGIQLVGTEVKSVRNGQVSLDEGFAIVEPKSMQLVLRNIDIAPYPHAGENQHDPKRPRRLLAHKREIENLLGKTSAKGATLVPTAMYFVRGRAKVEIAVGTGKRQHDKRQDMKWRDASREMRRAMTRKTI